MSVFPCPNCGGGIKAGEKHVCNREEQERYQKMFSLFEVPKENLIKDLKVSYKPEEDDKKL